MGAQEDRLATFPRRDDTVAKFALHQRIQATRGFVEHEQRRASGERSDQGDFLTVAGGIRFSGPVEVELKTRNKFGAVVDVDAGADIAEQFKGFGTGQRRPQCDVGRYVCQVSVGSADISCIDAEYLGTPAAGANETE